MSDTDRIRWQCRRGLLELDLILQRFLDGHYDRLDADERELFCELLGCPDNDLLDWVLGRAELPDARYRGMVRLLQAV